MIEEEEFGLFLAALHFSAGKHSWQRRKDGEKRLLAWWCRVLKDADGNVIGAFSSAHDITERKQAEEELRESEQRYRLLVETLPDGVIVHSQGRIVFANPASATIMGAASLADLTGKPVIEFVHPDHRELALNRIQQSLNEGVPAPLAEEQFVRLDGAPIDVEVVALPITYAGKPAMFTVFDDITERKRAEEELMESKALVDAVVENVPLMIFIKEATDLRFVIFNRAGEELLGYDRKALLGKNNLDLFPPEQAAHFMTKDREVLDGEAGMLDIPEEPILTAKKGQRLLHTRKICIRGADGATKYLLGISEDITERKRAEEEIKKQLDELQRWHNATLGRETRILDLKREVNELLGKAGQPPRYPSVET